MKATAKKYEEVWFQPKVITNILSLNNIRDKFGMTYYSGGDSYLTVQKPNYTLVRLMIRSDRLHYHDTGNRQLSVVTTVNQDSDGLIQRQITQYKNACAFQVTVGHPSIACLKYIIQGNIIANFPVIVQDIVKNIWRSLVSPQGYHQYSVPEEHQKQIPRDIRQ